MGFTVTEETKAKIGPILLRLVTAAYEVRGYKMDVTDWDALAEHDKAGFMEFVDQIVAELEDRPGAAAVAGSQETVDALVAAALAEGDETPAPTPAQRGEFDCTICGKPCKGKRGLNMHVKGMHAEEPVPA